MSNAYVGLAEAANILGTTKQTVRNWAAQGVITAGTDADVLSEMNAHKSGRPHEFFYFVDQLEQLRLQRSATHIVPDSTFIRIDKAAKALCITPRTLNRIRDRNNIPDFIGTDNHVYLKKADVAALEPGVDYRTSVNHKQLANAAEQYGLTAYRAGTT